MPMMAGMMPMQMMGAMMPMMNNMMPMMNGIVRRHGDDVYAGDQDESLTTLARQQTGPARCRPFAFSPTPDAFSRLLLHRS
jgi:hypothetical protein